MKAGVHVYQTHMYVCRLQLHVHVHVHGMSSSVGVAKLFAEQGYFINPKLFA